MHSADPQCLHCLQALQCQHLLEKRLAGATAHAGALATGHTEAANTGGLMSVGQSRLQQSRRPALAAGILVLWRDSASAHDHPAQTALPVWPLRSLSALRESCGLRLAVSLYLDELTLVLFMAGTEPSELLSKLLLVLPGRHHTSSCASPAECPSQRGTCSQT